MAVAAASLTGLLAYVYLGAQTERAPVVVAARSFPAHTILSADLLGTVLLPPSAIHPSALRSLSDADGQVSLVPRAAGEQILASTLARAQDAGQYRAVLDPEERALFLPAGSVLGGWAGLAQGDFVDLTVVLERQALTVAQGLEVLEVVFEASANLIGSRPETPAGVFLRVRPETAEYVALAAECGKMYFSVFGYTGVPVSTEGVWLDQLCPGGDESAETIWP